MAEPCVVTDFHGIATTPLEKLRFILFFRPVITGAVGEMMQRRTPCRMIGGVDAHMAGDIGKLANLRTPDFAIDAEIGIIIEHSFRNAAALAYLCVATECATADDGGFMHQRFYR
ncbi:hypothetical protein D9M72_562840 [compost metagenome]